MYQLQFNCHRDDVEALSDFLENTSAVSITLTDQEDDPILEPEPGTTPLWKHVIAQVLFTEESEAKEILKALSHEYPHLNASIETLPEKDWEREWMDQFHPMLFGKRLWICPSWQQPPEPDGINLILDPGLAFGTGTHETTALCLSWLDQAELDGKTIIDYGCGSGILALAALKLGANHVYAVDIDPQALTATLMNAETNQIEQQALTISKPEEIEKPADILIANILLKPLLTLKSDFKALLKPHCKLVVSGVLLEQVQGLIAHYQDTFKHCNTEEQGDWALVEFEQR